MAREQDHRPIEGLRLSIMKGKYAVEFGIPERTHLDGVEKKCSAGMVLGEFSC